MSVVKYLIGAFSTFIVLVLFIQIAVYLDKGWSINETYENFPTLFRALFMFGAIGGLVAAKLELGLTTVVSTVV